MNSYKSIIKADYLQRTRSYAFLITMLVSVCFAYTFVPPEGAKYDTVRIGDFVGENNAAWIGHITAIMASTFLWLLGFYLVSNGIKRDRETGVGQIIATSSMSNFKYLLAKAVSNFLVLLSITVVIMLMAVSLVLIRGGRYPFDAIQFFCPYLFATIPGIFFVSVLAVFAEVIAGRYTILQNLGFFILFMLMVSQVDTSTSPNAHYFDVLGVKQLTDGMEQVVNTHYSKSAQTVSVGFIFSDHNTKHFLFQGTQWRAGYILSRFLWIGLSFIILFIAARLFHRFDVKEKFAKKKIKKNLISESNRPLKEIHLSELPVASSAYGIFPFIKIEFMMLLRKGPGWFWLLNLGGFIALIFMPLTTAHQVGLPLLWFLQINRWSDIATKERFNRTHYFTYAAYKPLGRLLASQLIAGILLAAILSFPLIIRYLISGDYLAVANIIAGAVFIISFAICSGIVSGGKRLFEIVFFMLTYANITAVPILDYFGALHHSLNYITLLLINISGMLFTAFMFRKYEISHQ